MSTRSDTLGETALRLPVSDSFPSPPAFFEQRLTQLVKPGDCVLDAGCGAGQFLSFQFATVKGCKVVGADLSDDILLNPHLDLRARGDLNNLPFSADSFDVIACRMVIEHLKRPETVFAEFHRVLKPGGRLAIFTPNLLHYFGAAAKMTPHWFHRWFNGRIRGFREQDTFPTRYRANTKHRLNKQLHRSGFCDVDIQLIEGAPSVLAFNSGLYQCGVAYARLVNR